MPPFDVAKMFDVKGKVVALTGGGGVLCSIMAKALCALGARAAILDISEEGAARVVGEIVKEGGDAAPFKVNVLDKGSVEQALAAVVKRFGRVDVLINGAGGNKKEATTSDTLEIFDIPIDAFRWVFELNFVGTFIPSQVFGREFARQKKGSILNMSSMSALSPLTRTPAYSPAKAAVSNFTAWLAVHMAQNYSPNIRVNALAPGFFLTEQNRFLLTDEKTGEPTARGKTIIGHTPQARYGVPEDLLGAVVWLLSESSSFVTGITLPIDGGFSAFSGV